MSSIISLGLIPAGEGQSSNTFLYVLPGWDPGFSDREDGIANTDRSLHGNVCKSVEQFSTSPVHGGMFSVQLSFGFRD